MNSGLATTRLSALAQPFTIDRSYSLQPSSQNSSNGNGFGSVSDLDLAYHPSEAEPFLYRVPHPSYGSLVVGHASNLLGLASVGQISVTGSVVTSTIEQTTDVEANSFSEEVNVANTIFQLGESSAERSMLLGKADYRSRTKEPGLQTYDMASLKIMDPTNAELCMKPLNSSASELQQQLLHVHPSERCAKKYDPFTTKHMVCDALDYNVSQTSLLANLDTDYRSTKNVKPADGVSVKVEEKVACIGESLTDQAETKWNGESINSNPLTLKPGASKLRIKNLKVSKSKTLDLHDTETSIFSEKSFLMSDENDSDVDSPCWKGTQFYKSEVRASEPTGSENTDSKLDASRMLNPLAPLFVPAIAKQQKDKNLKHVNVGDSRSFRDSSFSSPGESIIVDFAEVNKHPLGMNSSAKNHCSNDFYEARDGNAACNSANDMPVSTSFYGLRTENLEHSSHDLEPHNRLNPLAPQFLPMRERQNVAGPEKKESRDDYASAKMKACLSSSQSPGDDRPGSSVMASVASDMSSVDVNWSSDGVSEPGKANLLHKSYESSVLESGIRFSEGVKLKHYNNRVDACNGLNPSAPRFSPSNHGNGSVSLEKKSATADLSSSKKVLFSTVSLPSGYKTLEVSASEIGALCHKGIHEPQRACGLSKTPYEKFSLEASFVDHPFLMEDYFKSNNQFPMCSNVALHASDFSSTDGAPPKTMPPKIDVKKLLNTMHDLSELLVHVKNFSNDKDLLNEHELLLAESIMENVHLYIGKGAQKDRMADASHPFASHGLRLPVDCNKIKKMKDQVVGHDSDLKSDEGIKCNSIAKV